MMACTQSSSSIEELVMRAARIIPSVWPLTRAVACNPLADMQHLPFWEAVEHIETFMHPSEISHTVNGHLIKWCQAFLDEGEAVLKMPDREHGFYRAWMGLAPFDRTLCPSKKARRYLATFPTDPKEALMYAFDQLHILSDNQELYCKYALAQLPGWAGYIKWYMFQQQKTYPIDLIEFLAVRLVITSLLAHFHKLTPIAHTFSEQIAVVFERSSIELSEKRYATALLQGLLHSPQIEKKKKVNTQFVFCMDVRAEPLRRQLEAQGFETFGYAGSFGVSLHTISFDEQIHYAESLLQTIGLDHDFASLIVLCGHGSSAINNPHAASLNCGACGTHKGGPYANRMASILNTASIRDTLKERGIVVPPYVRFIGAEHDTTTGRVRLGEERMPSPSPSWRGWSAVRPEWGQAKNAAIIIGPRFLSQHLDLEGRCFLHSYNNGVDKTGQYLEKILMGPLTVAHGINAHYFFSTCYPTFFGSGSKVTQNGVGKIGVMQGNGSDLMCGLPLQAVYSDANTPYHEPLRLLAVVYAPCQKLEILIQRQPLLQHLFFNQWIQLIAIDPDNHRAYQLQGERGWDRFNFAF
jgi:uncharacterized protein YbcC (UPF0753/DUF2309 family)